jgi:membrane-bound metal-dependent hydrolase YbcI (DUF457 family)
MFIGHIALGMGAKRYAPRTSLGLLIAAPIFADLLWPTLLLLGIEQVRIDPGNTKMTPLDFVHYPWSHSLLMLCVWGALIGGALFLASRWRADAWIVAALVVSHWFLDYVTHRPDMPLVPWGGPKLGLALWNLPTVNAVLEAAMFAGGVWLYFGTTRPVDRVGKFAMGALVAFLGLVYFANLFSPPPPSETALAWAAQISWLLPLWAWWGDRHRVVTAEGPSTA